MVTLSFLKARYSDESGDMFTSDVENERDDEDPGDLSESRVGPPRLNQDPAHPLPDRSAGWTLSPSGRTDRR